MSDKIVYATDDSFDAEVVNAEGPVLVDYWADWCGPCKMIAPILDEIAEEYAGKLKVTKLNIDENPATPPKFGIRGIPTLMIFKNGNVEATKVGGATLTKLLGTSAWYAPGAAVSELVKAIALDSKKMFPCSALLEGEYGLNDISLGVPCILGKNGIEKIVEISLSDAEKEKLTASAEGVSKVNALLEV